MLAGRRHIMLGAKKIATTPLLVPSFSSKGFPEVEKILKTTEEFISDGILVSAYDVHYEKVPSAYDFPEYIFLDSGGYEASKDVEFSDLGYTVHEPQEWTEDKHRSVVEAWSNTVPTILISYDNPNQRITLDKQVSNALELFSLTSGVCAELLVKPESEHEPFVNIDNVVKNIHDFAKFNIIGFTEKELGRSILERMTNIGRVRTALSNANLHTPIHIFGSLDTITTPLYFLSGADIFDGLTWLRFAYKNGYTSYIQNFTALEFGISTHDDIAKASIWSRNYYYMRSLQLSMSSYLNEGNYGCFKDHAEFFEQGLNHLTAKLAEA